MNTHPSYTLGARPETGRTLRAWAVLSHGTFSGLIFLTDVALIVAMSCFTGVAYHLAAYGEPGSIPSFVQVGVLAASLFAVSNAFRGEYRLANFFAFRPHGRRTVRLWNVTFVCLLVLGFLAQISVGYSRGSIVLFYIATFAGLIVLRFAIVRLTALALAGLVSAQRISSSAPAPMSAPSSTATSRGRSAPVSSAAAFSPRSRQPPRHRSGGQRSIAILPRLSPASAASSSMRSSC